MRLKYPLEECRTTPGVALPTTHAYLAGLPHAKFFDLGMEFPMLKHKAASYGWRLGRIAKTVYWESKDGKLYAGVIPGDERIDSSAFLDIVGKSRLRPAQRFPQGSGPGSLGPFLSDADVSSGLVQKILIDVDDYHTPMDFAVPGRPDMSIHVPAGAVLGFLQERYGKIVERASIREPRRDYGLQMAVNL